MFSSFSLLLCLAVWSAPRLDAAASESELPKIVLVGDSIRLSYAPIVAKQFAGKAKIVSPSANGSDSKNVLKHLEQWVIREQPAVVQFNCGIHDTKKFKTTGRFQVSPDEYEENLRKIVDTIRNKTPAVVLFATTTPILDERAAKARQGRDYELLGRSVEQYNEIAIRVMRELNVPVNDLHKTITEAGAADLIGSDGVHLQATGRELVGKTVAEFASRNIPGKLEWIEVSRDNRSFVFADSGKQFVPWGFNYDHQDGNERLIEDYWHDEWPTIEEDFREMRQLGANVVRIHLQFGAFMETSEKPNERSLEQLEKLVKLAEETRLYLDLTGLGCYHKKDVPPWYDRLIEKDLWNAQARFWEAVAQRCADSPAVFCYDLMNEPIVPGDKKPDDWLGGAFGGKHFVQFITLSAAGRPRHEVAKK